MSTPRRQRRAPPPPESVRVPVRHGIPLRAACRRSTGGEPLRLAVDRRHEASPAESMPRRTSASPAPGRRNEPRGVHRRVRTRSPTAWRSSTATRSGGCSAAPRALLLVAVVSMLATPLWITRRRAPATIDERRMPRQWWERWRELAREQASTLRDSSGTPSTRPAGGLAFGHPGRYSVAWAAGSWSSRRSTHPRSGRSSDTSSRTSGTATSESRTSRSLVRYAFILVAVIPFIVTMLDDRELLTNATCASRYSRSSST